MKKALVEALTKSGLTPEEVRAMPDDLAGTFATLIEGGRRHARVDVDRLDTAIRTLIDVRYDTDDMRGKARAALDSILQSLPTDLMMGEAEAEDGIATLIETLEPDGSVVDVLLIRAGVSENGRIYTEDALKAAVPLFEGVRAFVPDGPDHFGFGPFGRRRGAKELVGWYSTPRWIESTNDKGQRVAGVAAHLNVLESASWLRGMLRDAFKRGKRDLIGFSIVGDGDLKRVREGGRALDRVDRIKAIDSVDPVVNPAAGGMALSLVASKEGPVNWATLTLVEAIKGLATGSIFPDDLKANRVDLCDAIAAGTVAESTDSGGDVDAKVTALVEAQIGAFRTSQMVEAKIALRAGLHESIKARIRAATSGKVLTEAQIDEQIKAEVDYIAAFAPAIVRDGGPIVTPGANERDKIVESVYDVLAGKSQDSIKALYVDLTGDRSFTGKIAEGGRLTESLTTASFGEILGDSITRRMLDYYAWPGRDSWRSIVQVNPIRDFRTQRRIRYGGYGNLPAVSQGAAYGALTSPTDEEATFAVSKRGGTEDLTMEMIVNDDLGSIRDLPRRLGTAAAQTLYEFVYDFPKTNATIYDSVALAHASHGNLGATALSAASLTAGRTSMLKQADMSNSKRVGIRPRYLLVPVDLEQTAFELTETDREVASANNTLNFVKTFGLSVIVVDYWTDTNDWWLVADPSQVPTIEIGFLNGNETPELFLQDAPTLGNVFTNDKLTYKIRHIYGGAVLDFRGFFGASGI